MTSAPWFLVFETSLSVSPDSGLSLLGGKGANLARLAQAGFPVPGGFIVTTRAYGEFISKNDLESAIQAALPVGAAPGTEELESASIKIRALFESGAMPEEMVVELLAMYHGMGEGAVAVRSSATAEDLPEMSFAGQQDTYLNVVGGEALRKAVVDCWASLWTARAIGYRIRNGVPQEGIALAVVVQQMVESQVSGVLFTADPLTGSRLSTVINAAFGLGEALVSGRVEPDYYIVDTAAWRIVEKKLGAKALSIHGQAGGGTAQIEQSRGDTQALPDDQILALARMGQQVAAEYAFPQDIEWAWAGGKLYLLQSRAITSLYPTPAGMPPEPLKVLLSFAAVQGILDPITPLGQDTLQTVFRMGASLFRIPAKENSQTVLFEAGERLWVNFTSVLQNSNGRKVIPYIFEQVEPTVHQAILQIWDDPRLQPQRKGFSPRAIWQMSGFFPRLAGNVLLNLISPKKRRAMIVGRGERILAEVRGQSRAMTGSARERIGKTADLMLNVARGNLPGTFLLFVSGVASGMVPFNALRMLSKQIPEENTGRNWTDLILELTRGLPHNPTTEMDLDLWRVAAAIQRSPDLMAEFRQYEPHELAARYQKGLLPEAGCRIVDKFLDRYGGRGLGEIDLGRQRWREDPTHVFEILSSYIQIDNPDQAPDIVFGRGEAAAQAALERLCAGLRKTRGGWFKARAARIMVGRMRELMGARESPKFFAVRLFGEMRQSLLPAGAELVREGVLDRADDLMFLTYSELRAFSHADPRDWKQIIAGRRESYRREKMRRQIPRLLLSDGRAFYEGIMAPDAAGNTLLGDPVSPGVAEGLVRVVIDPRQANLRPGEIMVCPGTDPSWTPLFLSAAGLVMETGGMMTHGAVVAREYGIPAIVGVDQATHRLKTGERIRIDGSSGVIALLDGEQE
jgi:rifampicin phosphotransferase